MVSLSSKAAPIAFIEGESAQSLIPASGCAQIVAGEIIQAIGVLRRNPLIGRPVSADTKELVIGRRARGYVALYRYIEQADTVFVLAIRSRREAGYGGA